MTTEQMRAEFEATMGKVYPEWSFASDGCGGYHAHYTDAAWMAWQAARAIAPNVSSKGMAEKDGTQVGTIAHTNHSGSIAGALGTVGVLDLSQPPPPTAEYNHGLTGVRGGEHG